jgi:glyoxylase-like metal-dependent hydrolase (beta-lactamase superfamily II)
MSTAAQHPAVYAIRFAYREESSRKEHFYRGDPCGEDAMPIDYFVWAIVSADRAVLVDAGFTREVAEKRGARFFVQRPDEALAGLGVDLDAVRDVVLTHLHYDHTGHLPLFPAAQVHLQREEWEYWTGPYAARGENPHLIEQDDLDYLAAHRQSGMVTLHDGDAEVIPGVRVHRVGGHTRGLQVVVVDTARGPLVLASDASHFYANIGEDRPYSIVDHLPSMYDAFDWIIDTAGDIDHVIPGHDPQVLERYPAVPGLDGVVQLA